MAHALKRISLQPDDLLFFLHIPKTGGISLQTILESHFPPEAICPLHSFVTREKFEQYTPEQRARWRFVRGHMAVGSYSYITRFVGSNPICLTFLRDPVLRIVSEYQHILRRSSHWLHQEFTTRNVSLKEYVTNPQYAYLVSNYQVFMLAGTVLGHIFLDRSRENGWLLSDEAQLALAKQRLEQYAFVGLTERYDESVALLHYTFGWEPLAEIPLLNTAPKKTSREHLDEATQAALLACTELDRELYAFAQVLFAERYGQMKAALSAG